MQMTVTDGVEVSARQRSGPVRSGDSLADGDRDTA
jgi:hypothetical protein